MSSSAWLVFRRGTNLGEELSSKQEVWSCVEPQPHSSSLCHGTFLPGLSFNSSIWSGWSPTSAQDMIKKSIKVKLSPEVVYRKHWAQAVEEWGLFGVKLVVRGARSVQGKKICLKWLSYKTWGKSDSCLPQKTTGSTYRFVTVCDINDSNGTWDFQILHLSFTPAPCW